MNATRTTCAYCGVGCGILATKSGHIEGDAAHPANAGRLCSKGSALGETLTGKGRLLHPRIGARDTTWNEALDNVAARLKHTISLYGPDSVAFYVSGQLLTEDYYVANKLMKGFIGSANIDTNSRLCMSSAVVAHQRAFGEDVVPGCYEDLELADVVVLVGSNTAWCHPVLYRRIEKARRERPSMRVVVVDPRHTPTCDLADLHLALRSGSDVVLFDGLLAYLEREGFADAGFVATHTSGAEAAVAAARAAAATIDEVADACALDRSDVEEFYRLFAHHQRVVTAWSQGVNQSSSGSDKATSIINVHLLTGRIGKPGMGPLSLTGQPNAMGGREVGGMATMLAAHLSLDDPAHCRLVQDFWKSPRIATRAGLRAVEMFDAVADGRIKAIWIMATNPAVSLPDADRVRAALAQCEFVVVSDCVAETDTTALAHVLLPAAAWGEKDGTSTNSERCISRQRTFREPFGLARPDWWIVSEVATRMGYGDGFAYRSPAGIFDEHARLSALASSSGRAFDIGGLAGLAPAEYDALAPIQWPVCARDDAGTRRLFGDGSFSHADGRARLVPTIPREPAHALTEEFPFVLNTGRIRDQWHTMTRTGLVVRLAEHVPEPFVDLHSDDAAEAHIEEGDLVRVTTRWGSAVLRARVGLQLRRGMLFAPMHWSASNSSSGRVGAVVNPAVDADSGEPELKHTPAAIERVESSWHAVLASRGEELAAPPGTWWVRVEGDDHARIELAGAGGSSDWTEWSRRTLASAHQGAELLEYIDDTAGTYRGAAVAGGRLLACLFVSRGHHGLPPRGWLAQLFEKPVLSERDRMSLLAARPLGGCADSSAVVCSCFGVRKSAIAEAIAHDGLTTEVGVGARLKAGTNCGSCLPEIRALLASGARVSRTAA